MSVFLSPDSLNGSFIDLMSASNYCDSITAPYSLIPEKVKGHETGLCTIFIPLSIKMLLNTFLMSLFY